MTTIARVVRPGAAFLIVILAVYAWGGTGISPALADPAPVPEALNTNADVDTGHDTAPRLAGDASGNWIAIWSSTDTLSGTIGTDADILFSRSANSIEWSAPAALNTNAGGDTGGDGQVGMLDLGTDGSGTWIAVWTGSDVAGSGTDGDILFSRSDNGGLTWSAPATLNSNATTDSTGDLSPRIAADGLGNWVAVWHTDSDGDNDVYSARSTNNGVTWSARSLLDSHGGGDTANDVFAQIATNGTGTWIAAWQSDYNGGGPDLDADIYTARSVDGGASWSTAAPLNSNALTDTGDDASFVTGAGFGLVSGGGSRWIASWSSNENLGGGIGTDYDMLTAVSTNDGVTWFAPTVLNGDASTDSADDGYWYGSDLGTDQNGSLAAIWQKGGLSAPWDTLAARSTNNGLSFNDPVSLRRAGPLGGDRHQSAAYAQGNWMFAWSSTDDLDGVIGTDDDILRRSCLGDSRLDCLRDLPRLIVDDTGDGPDASAGDGTCATAGAVCTLRAAIEESNALGGARIYFRIPGAGPHVISPATALPAVSATALIDGMTEPDFMGSPAVRIDGSSLINEEGIEVTSDFTTVKGLSITDFSGVGGPTSPAGSGIYAHTGQMNYFTGNFLGIAPDGVTAAGNRNGAFVHGPGASPPGQVGGPTEYERNIISGNTQAGLFLFRNKSSVVEGNYIGTDSSGTSAVGNGAGIVIFSDVLGESVDISITGNVVSGNLGSGLSFSGNAGTFHTVRGNFIGAASDGTSPLGNGGNGIGMGFPEASDNLIGGTSPGDANIIAYNAGDGVRIDGATQIRNTIRGNSIHSNTGRGIENISGGNTELTPPLITVSLPASTFGTACNNCTVDVYSDNDAEGRIYEGSTTADGAGNWALMATPSGPNLTATATDGAGNTSEFSAAVVLGDADSDGVADVSEGECGDSIDNDGNGFVNDGCPQVGGTAESGADCTNSVDDDGDSWVNDGCPSMGSESAACGSKPGDEIPERVDGPLSGQDDDGDTLVDEALPSGAELFDCDGDGYTGTQENHVYSYVPQTNGDQKACQEYDLAHPNPNPDIKPSLRWPSDFNKTSGVLISFNKIDVLDLTSFLSPVRYLGTNVGTNPGDVRFDLVPGKGLFTTDINVLDLTSLIAGPSAYPPMLGGAKAFGGPACPWPP